jgi:uncharacterized protein (DUF2062 family)
MEAHIENGGNPGFFRRRVVQPVLDQLRQGITPERIAWSVALGLVVGVVPVLGIATGLCALVGWWLGLNQPVIQVVNYLAYPLQIALLLPFYRAGETLLGREHLPLSLDAITGRFQEGFWVFLREFGGVLAGGVLVWLLVAPVASFALYKVLRPVLRGAAARIQNGGGR